jgi:ribosomal protein S12
MTKRIIYKQDNGTVAIIIPSDEALQSMTIEQIAKKDVPTGYKYKIVDVSEVPSDREFRNAWIIDEAELTDGVGK